LPIIELDELLRQVTKSAISACLNLSDTPSKSFDLGDSVEEEDSDFSQNEGVAELVDSLMPYWHTVFQFFRDASVNYNEDIQRHFFQEIFADHPSEHLLGSSNHDRELAERMVRIGNHIADVYGLPEEPPFSAGQYVNFIDTWRNSIGRWILKNRPTGES
jgi:hypothetical protein